MFGHLQRIALCPLLLALLSAGCDKPADERAHSESQDRVQEIVGRIGSPDPDVRRSAWRELVGEDPGRAVPHLIDGLADPDARVRAAAAMLLDDCGEKAQDAVPALINALRDSDDMVRSCATESLCAIKGGQFTIDVLASHLRSSTESRGKLRAIYCLIFVPPDTRPKGGPAVLQSLWDSDPAVRSLAAQFFQGIGEAAEAPAAIPRLIELLADDNEDVKVSAICALGANRAAAKDAIGPLREIAKKGNRRLRENAEWALNLIE